MRITARIDESYEKKLQTIQQKTHLNTTEIIKQTSGLLYDKSKLSGKEKSTVTKSTDLPDIEPITKKIINLFKTYYYRILNAPSPETNSHEGTCLDGLSSKRPD